MPHRPPKQPRRWRTTLVCAGLTLASLVVGGVWAVCSKASRELDERVARIRTEIEAARLRHAEARPVLVGTPQPGNAVDDYRALEWAWGSEVEAEPDPRVPTTAREERAALGGLPLPEAVADALHDYLDGETPLSVEARAAIRERAPLLHHLRRGLGRERCDWGHDYALGVMAPYPDVLALREAAVVRACEGCLTPDPDDALDAGFEVLALAQDLDRNPSLIMGLVGTSTERVGLRVLERALARFALTPAQLDRIDAFLLALPELDFAHHLDTARMEVEVTFLARTGRTLRPELTAVHLGEPDEEPAPLSHVFTWRELRGVDHFDRLTREGFDVDFPRRNALAAAFDHELERSSYREARLAVGSYIRVGNHLDEVRVLRACLRGLVAAHRHRLEHRSFPEQLPELGEDPFRPGAALRYARTGEQVRLYSVGPDQRDDGGARTGALGRGPDVAVHGAVPPR